MPGGIGEGRRGMDAERFEKLVDEAVGSLPTEFADRLDNVDVVVEARPSRPLLRKMGLAGRGTLLGLYEGVPQIRRDHAYGAVLPDRIVIYREPVLAEAAARAADAAGADEAFDQAVRDVVRATVLHEIGHHFGLDEEDLRRYED
jgi:predicted Zn-dependent protease with MMP-like domain